MKVLIACMVIILQGCSVDQKEDFGHWHYEKIKTACPSNRMLGSGCSVIKRIWCEELTE